MVLETTAYRAPSRAALFISWTVNRKRAYSRMPSRIMKQTGATKVNYSLGYHLRNGLFGHDGRGPVAAEIDDAVVFLSIGFLGREVHLLLCQLGVDV